jgi:aromatic-L-amino-acid decarboxylase
VKSREDLHQTFHRSPEYYRSSLPEDEPLNWYEYTIEGTRPFRALKLWMSWKFLGTDGFGRLVEQNADLAAYLARRCRELPMFEALPEEPELSVVCFRHVPEGMHADQLDAYQDRLQRALEVSGEGWVSTTRLRGVTYLRAGVVNYLSTEEDVDRVLDALVRLSPEAARGLG